MNNITVQTGPLYQCFACGSPALIGECFATAARVYINAGWGGCALDEWGSHLWYLQKSCKCQPVRVVRLGDAIAPLYGSDRDGSLIEADIPQIRAALAAIARAVPEGERSHSPEAKIVYRLVSGQMSPDDAIAALRELLIGHARTERV